MMKNKNPIVIYNKLSAPVKASLWFTVCNIAQKGVSLLSTPIFTRIMTTEQYGVYAIYQSWYSIITIFATLNLYLGVYNNGMTKFPNDRKRFTSSMQGLSTTITIGLFFIYVLNMDFWNNLFELSSLFVVTMFIELLFVPAYTFWSAGQRYDYKYRKLVAATLCMTIMSPIIGVLTVINSSYKAEARVLSYAGVQICFGLVLYIYNAISGKTFFQKKYWKFALAFNIPLIPHYLSQTILNQSDRIMISKMIGSGEAAIYSVAYTVSMMMTIVTNAINNSFVPYTYKSLKENKTSGIKKNSNFLVLMIAVACTVAMAFGPEIIRIFAAPEYYEARWVIPPVAASLFFMFLFPLYCNIEFYYEETKYIMVASCLAAVVNIGLNYVAIKAFGYIAAAYTTLICYMLLAVTHYYVHLKVLKKHACDGKIYDTRFFVILSALLLGTMCVMTVFYDHMLMRYMVVGMLLIMGIVKRRLISQKLNDFMKERKSK